LGWIAYRSSPTFDEVAHLPAGISIWSLRRFDIYSVNPPLTRVVAAIPAVVSGSKTDWSHVDDDPFRRPEFQIGRNFVTANGDQAFGYYTMGRWMCIPISLLGACTCYCWARDIYGVRSGLLAMALWCYSPSILGHGSLITSDVSAAAFAILCAYRFRCWLLAPNWQRAVWAGLTLGLVELTKMTWMILVPLWVLVWIGHCALSNTVVDRRGRLVQASQLCCMLFIALYVLNSGYLCDGSFEPIGQFRFHSKTFGRLYKLLSDRTVAGIPLSALPCPFPSDYVRGIDIQKVDFERPRWSYLCGTWRTEGWWYYYLYALTFKSPHGDWLLGFLALTTLACRKPRRCTIIETAMLLLPAVCLFVVVSAHTQLNRHMRYVIPALPFLFVVLSSAAAQCSYGRRLYCKLLGLAVTSTCASSLFAFPHNLAYFNELVGGSLNGDRYLANSNIDWAQDFMYLKRWTDAHPEARPLYTSCFGSLSFADAGVVSLPAPSLDETMEGANSVPEELEPGWYAISVNHLVGDPQSARVGFKYIYFKQFRPVACAGYSIRIYHLTKADLGRD
jgi:hypothetical protein